jgi:dienelactone hydrolase
VPNRRAPLLAALLLVLALVAGACSSGTTTKASPTTVARPAATDTGTTTDTSSATDTGAAPDTSTTTAATTAGPYAVGSIETTYVDHTRKTNADPMRGPGFEEKPERTLPVIITYPAQGTADDKGTPTKSAQAAPGKFPLVVFSHGITGTGPAYVGLTELWSRAGYIVVSPTYPLTSAGAKFPGDPVALSDYQNQPADVSFIIDSVLADAAKDGAPLHGHIDESEIGAAGHSLGAITTMGVTYNSCCIDKRIKAAIEIAGVELPFKGGSWQPFPKTPLLLVHGEVDRVVPVGGSNKIFKDVTGPAWYLHYDQADHIGVVFAGKWFETTKQVSIDFLDAYLKHQPAALEADPAKVKAAGLGTLTPKNV